MKFNDFSMTFQGIFKQQWKEKSKNMQQDLPSFLEAMS